MSTKYQGLPDIDTAPDIFETPDEPDTLLRPNDNGLGDDDVPVKINVEGIDNTGLPSRRKAERVFGRGAKRPDPSNLTSRPRLPPLSRHVSTSSSSSSSGSEDDIPTTRQVPRESTASRLRRLKAELAEVEAELASKPPPGTDQPTAVQKDAMLEGKRRSVLEARRPVDVLSELTGLKERLKRVDVDGVSSIEAQEEGESAQSGSSSEWRERLERLSQFRKQIPSGEGEGGPASDGAAERAGQLSGENSLRCIDKRLAVVEDALGPIGDGVDHVSGSSPLIPTLNKHDHLLALLTQPRHLDAISRRIKLLLVDLDRAAAASKRNPMTSASGGTAAAGGGGQGEKSSSLSLSQAEYQNLQSLFNILPRLDPLLPILSPILARLRSLNTLHAEASEIAESLRKLQGEDKRSTEQIGELKAFTEKVAHGLDEASEGVLRNWDAVEGRLKSLDERLKNLESS
ncbi:hypothetical protein I317_02952 [Kwoniella heveanensis CBS 569]|uniref:Dynactin 2 n=1 Tax=Kwoniella heveanensis BCC8398 TaxID=1296120 RepID=A0A1B9GLB3_9TREE|nr:hypothetical protein I316_06467 [Kwoniella heveanensis BCC8398]OCF43242.1 hypothetical protein I317_02952 [Kwoniella heveanensis CBS 569]